MTDDLALTHDEIRQTALIDVRYALSQLKRAIKVQTVFIGADAISRAMDSLERAAERLQSH